MDGEMHMVQLKPVQWNFINGAIGPKYRGRVGSPIYYNALESSLNVVVTPQGGLMRRPGTINVNTQTGITRLESFKFSDDTSYWLAFTSDTVKIYNNADVLKATISSTGITGDMVSEFDIDQSFDTLFITHRDFPDGMKKIVRTDDTSWAISNVEYYDGPWEKLNTNRDQRMEVSGTTGNITIKAYDNAGTPAVIPGFFTANDIGRLVRVRHFDSTNTGWGCAKITALTNPPNDGSEVDATVQSTGTNNETVFSYYNSGTKVKNWRLGAWSDVLGYPEKLAFRGNRLFSSRDNRLWGCRADDLDRYSPDEEAGLDVAQDGNFVSVDSSALDLTLLNLRGAKIRWMFSDQVMHIGTDEGHYVLRGSTAFGPITPANASVVPQSRTRCADIKPVSFETLFFVDQSRKKLLRSDYNFRTDRYEETDMNFLADDILDGKVVKMVKITYPWDMIWVVLEDGKMACMTYDKTNETIAWTKHQHALGNVKDMTTVVDANGQDRIYLTVDDGSTVYAEKFADWMVNEGDLASEYVLTDSTTVDNTGGTVSVVTGLDRFNGTIPYVIDDLGIQTQTTAVSSGSLTLDNTLQGGFTVGKNFDVNFKTLNLDYADSQNSTVGSKKQVAKVYVGLYRTLNLKVTQSGLASGQEIYFRGVSDPFSSAPELFTGQKSAIFPARAEGEIQLEFSQTIPAPLTINYLAYKLEVHQ